MDIFKVINAGPFTEPLRVAAARWGIGNCHDQARWLAQVAVESAHFTATEENLHYSATRLLAVFAGRNGLQTMQQAVDIVAGGEQAIGEAIYGGQWGEAHLGNNQPGDGFKFRGHGLLQTTGRWNHNRVSQALYGDARLLDTPELLTLAEGAADSAGFYWHSKSLNGVTDVAAITRAINGGVNGLGERQAITTQLYSCC